MRIIAVLEDGELEYLRFLWKNRYSEFSSREEFLAAIPKKIALKLHPEFMWQIFYRLTAPISCKSFTNYVKQIKIDMADILDIE